MGTNYYHYANVCEHCGRGDDPTHIGKASAGWTFGWHATETERSCADWFKRLESGVIRDEYGDVISAAAFRDMVDRRRSQPHNHATEHPRGSFHDSDGCSFSEGDFS